MREKSVPLTFPAAVCIVAAAITSTAPGSDHRNSEYRHQMDNLDFIEAETGPDPQYAVIWLHGLGADGHDFEPIVPELALPPDRPARFIFPHAPMRAITINNGMVMRGWYDIYDFPVEREKPRADRNGLEESGAIVRSLIARENRRGISTHRIFLAGFSQGGAVALSAGLRLEQKLAGIIALSSYLPDFDTLEDERSRQNADTPIFMAHGSQDEIIPVSGGRESRDFLKTLGYSVTWHTYNMPHSVHPDEIGDISTFIKNILARGGSF